MLHDSAPGVHQGDSGSQRRKVTPAGAGSRLAGLFVGILASVLLLAGPASADPLAAVLSELSSNEGAFPAASLDATLDFSVIGSTLTLDVANLTDATTGFDIDQLYFNVAAAVTGLTLDSVDGGSAFPWQLSADKGANPFGTFDFRIEGNTGGTRIFIDGGASTSFSFTIGGVGVTDADFFVLTTDGSPVAAFAARFNSTAGSVIGASASATSGSVPEPGTALLVGIGVSLLALARRRV